MTTCRGEHDLTAILSYGPEQEETIVRGKTILQAVKDRTQQPPTISHEEAARRIVASVPFDRDSKSEDEEALVQRIATYATTVEREALERAARIAERHDERQDFLDQGKIIAASIRAAGSGERST